jgi:hypothetical protein
LAMICCDLGMILGGLAVFLRIGFFFGVAWGGWAVILNDLGVVYVVICCDLLVIWESLVVSRGDLGGLWGYPRLG